MSYTMQPLFPQPLGWGSQASSCELMAVRTPTVNREIARAHAQKGLGHCHSPTSRLRCDSQLSGRWERRFTTLPGAIHNSGPSIHNLIHTFWQGRRLQWRSLSQDRHSHGPIVHVDEPSSTPSTAFRRQNPGGEGEYTVHVCFLTHHTDIPPDEHCPQAGTLPRKRLEDGCVLCSAYCWLFCF